MQTSLSPSVCGAFLGCQIEKAVDELNLPRKIVCCHPSSLPLPDHVDCFVALNRSPSRLEFSEALLGVHSTFDDIDDPLPECCSSTAPVGVNSGCAASLPFYCRGSRSYKSVPGRC